MLWVLIIAAVLGVLFVLIYNQLVRGRFLVKEGVSGIDVQLKRRHDLIPNIVQAVQGYMQHERKTLEDLTALRAQAAAGGDMKARSAMENGISQLLKSVIVVAENYPNLKASDNFLELQRALSKVEDEIQLSRLYYNGAVRDYNTKVESIPSNIVAGLCGFQPAEFFEIQFATERQTPDVKFN